MTTIQALYDVTPIRLQLVESDGSGRVVARGEFGRCGVPTANKRSYGRDIIESNIQRLNEDLGRRRVFGELDHPQDGRTSLQRVSHVITKLEIDKNGIVVGEAEILNTPHGLALKAILEANCEVGVSSRGNGSVVSKNGIDEVQNDFLLKTYDFVADPATKTAYPQAVREALEEADRAVEALAENLTADMVPETIRLALISEATTQSSASLAEAAGALDEEKNRALMLEATIADLNARLENAKTAIAVRLPEMVATMQEKALADAKAQSIAEMFADPAIGASKMILEKVVDLLRPLITDSEEAIRLSERNEHERALEDALTAADLLVANLRMECACMKAEANAAAIKSALDLAVVNHAKPDAIRALIGPLDKIDSLESLNARLEVIYDSLGRPGSLGPAEESKYEARIAAAQNEADELRAKNAKLVEDVAVARREAHAKSDLTEDLDEKRNKAVSIGLRLDAVNYGLMKIIGRPDAISLSESIQRCQTRDAVDLLLTSRPVRRIEEGSDDAKIRAAAGRGAVRILDEENAASRNPSKGSFTMLEEIVSADEFSRLAGTGGQ